jgi:hypothetical protein
MITWKKLLEYQYEIDDTWYTFFINNRNTMCFYMNDDKDTIVSWFSLKSKLYTEEWLERYLKSFNKRSIYSLCGPQQPWVAAGVLNKIKQMEERWAKA